MAADLGRASPNQAPYRRHLPVDILELS